MRGGDPRHVVVHSDGQELAGEVRPGESWAAAARRVAAPVGGVPLADDLSGDPLLFVLDRDQVVDLRAMTRGDLPQLARWLRASHVRRW